MEIRGGGRGSQAAGGEGSDAFCVLAFDFFCCWLAFGISLLALSSAPVEH